MVKRVIVFEIIIFIIVLILYSSIVVALEDLNELENRVSRKNINTFYSGENASNYYIWQPQTVIYKDTNSGLEVMIWTQTDNVQTYSSNEYEHQPWSADGKRFAFLIDKDTEAFIRDVGFYFHYPWFVGRSDGSYIRHQPGAAARGSYNKLRGFDWSPVEPDVYYATYLNYDGYSGLDRNMLNKHIVNDTAVSYQEWVDLIEGDISTPLYPTKDSISSDGKIQLFTSGRGQDTAYIVQIEPSDRRGNLLNWWIDIGQDTYWGNTPEAAHDWHDEMFVGSEAGRYGKTFNCAFADWRSIFYFLYLVFD